MAVVSKDGSMNGSIPFAAPILPGKAPRLPGCLQLEAGQFHNKHDVGRGGELPGTPHWVLVLCVLASGHVLALPVLAISRELGAECTGQGEQQIMDSSKSSYVGDFLQGERMAGKRRQL
jgi:hypothetical protein